MMNPKRQECLRWVDVSGAVQANVQVARVRVSIIVEMHRANRVAIGIAKVVLAVASKGAHKI
jgi:hypothetical protein